MFINGKLWLDSDGKIKAINYQTSKEKMYRSSLIEKQTQTLHPSIREYEEPVLEWKTAKFHIRIDDLGNDNYRYAPWSVEKKTSEIPDLVLSKGKLVFEGSGGNHHYSFTSGKYIYRCYVSVIGTSQSAPGILSVYKGTEQLLSENVIKVITPE
jgi:hypothetical protein